tara:strand:+ start:2555 stop:3730 length:1176 start_codon:yes stop_codon:yes gene_type:complete
MIPLVKDTIDKEDIDSLIKWLETYPRLTKGNLTLEYEKKWSAFINRKYSAFVNSGSSANLLMIYALIEAGKLEIGDKVIIPAVSWATDLTPVVQLGLTPILCDCNLEDLSIDINHFKELIITEKPKALICVSVLGLVPKMEDIVNICNENNILLLEDACESLGSEFKNKKLGTFGLISTFSTFFGHHMSTIEGGMICTDDQEISNIIRGVRSHGWDRDMDEDYRNNLRKQYDVKDFQSLYTFYYYGFNLRSTDLQAFIGLNQLKKLNFIIKRRNQNYDLYHRLLSNDIWKPPKNTKDLYISNFSYPIIYRDREKIVSALNDNDISVRPLICGSLALQPFWKKKYPEVYLKNATIVNNNGLYVPNNHQISEQDIQKICNIINETLSTNYFKE